MNFLPQKRTLSLKYWVRGGRMGEKSIKHKFRNSLLFFIIMSIAVICYAHLNESYRLGFTTYVQPIWIYLFILFIFTIEFVKNLMEDLFIPSLMLYSLALSISMAFSALINMKETEVTIYAIVLYSFPWMAVLYLSYFLKKSPKSYESESNVIYFLLATTIFFSYLNMENVSEGSRIAINSIYWLVLCLPFILKLKARLLRYSGILFVLVATAISMKRTAIIAVLLGLSTYAIAKHMLNIKLKRSGIVSGVLIIVISAFVIYSYDYYAEKYHFDLQQRFQNAMVDGGSGRDSIYKDVVDMQFKSSVFGWVFGHGQNAVAIENGISAHNDFLEILFDYGLIGFVLYLGIYVKLIRQLRQMLSSSSELMAPFAASIVMFFVISIFSHLITIPTYCILLCLFWGLNLAEYSSYAKLNIKSN